MEFTIVFSPKAATELEQLRQGRVLVIDARYNCRRGFVYRLGFATEQAVQEAGNLVSGEFSGIPCAVPQPALPLVSGIELDYVEQGPSQAAGFSIKNPNKGSCGCGGNCGCGGHQEAEPEEAACG